MEAVNVGIQLGVLAAGYLIGAAAIGLGFRLAGTGQVLAAAPLMVTILPLAVVLLAEAFTRLWTHTPGTLGTGGLFAFVPMLVAGSAIALLAQAALFVLEPFDPFLPRDDPRLTAWLGLAAACSLLALALWRFWPEPVPKLF